MAKDNQEKTSGSPRGGDAIYGLGMIGALIYYLQVEEGLWAIVLAFPKAIFWPAFLVYDVLKFIA